MEDLLHIYRRIYALRYAAALLSWDMETYMPPGSSKERGEVSGILSLEKQRIFLSSEFKESLREWEKKAESSFERGVVRVLKRELKYYERVPPEVIKEMEKVTSEARVAWRKAKENADFKIFQPYLEKIVDLTLKIAEYLGYEKHPYDALLDLYEEGLTTEDVERMFSPLRKELPSIIERIDHKVHPLEETPYERKGMEQLNREVLDLLGFDWETMRLDVSAHPFTESIGLYDVRITTWYSDKDFKRSLLATIHEFGHALYERSIDPSYHMTPLQGGVSLGVHESQSRFWENMVGRSSEFSRIIAPLIEEYLHLHVSSDDIYEYFNTVRPSYIRVEADEVTYNLHILIRYEMEREMLEGTPVNELPQLWNEKMEKYLGIIPSSDREGILQDIHWSLGAIGYFPTYTIGTILAVQIGEKMNVSSYVEKGDFEGIRKWLRDKIHKYGALYSPKELMERSIGEYVNPHVFLQYIKRKYLRSEL